LKNHKLALFLSFLYSGVGQIYKGHTLKGIDFIVLYTLAVLGSFFAPAFKLTLLARTVWPLLWVIGMVDAYIGETMSFRRRSHIKKWALLILPGVIISTLVFYIHMRSTIYGMMGWWQESSARQYTSTSTRFYSIQVGAFLDEEKANRLRDELLEKEYPAVVERQKGTQRRWYHVYVGQFQTRGQAIAFGEKLRKQEGHAYSWVQRRVTEEEEKKENDKPLEDAEDKVESVENQGS
jgi:hypothetical protein